MAHASRWLSSGKLDCSAFTDELACEFVMARRAAGYYNFRSPRAMAQLLAYLTRGRVAPEPKATPDAQAGADLLESFRYYLTVDRGLVVGTVDN